MKAADLIDCFIRFIGHLKPSDEVLLLYESVLIDIHKDDKRALQKQIDNLQTEIGEFEGKINRVHDLFIEGELNKVGMDLHPTKTKIHKAKDGVVFLGFLFKVTDTGKVLMFRDPKRVKEIKRRLRRLTNKIIRNQDYSIGDLDISYKCVKACMEKGNSKRLLRSMEQLYRKLKGEIQNAKRNDNQGKAAA
jgi:hypothetical protein